MTEFRENPTLTKPLRTPEEYDSCVKDAKKSWTVFRNSCLNTVRKRKAAAENQRLLQRVRAPGSKTTVKRILAKSTLEKLRGIHFQGVKYYPSPFNSDKLGYHVCKGPSLPVCIAHDFFEGIVKNLLPQILQNTTDKGWFDIHTLNRRIKKFPYDGSDLADAATPLKSLKASGGNAAENWTLLRLLPFLTGDLVQNQEDDFWQLFLKLKVVVEYNVAKTCRNFKNITHTLSRKYACRFAYDHSAKLLEDKVLHKSNHSSLVISSSISEERKEVIPPEVLSEDSFIVLTKVSVHGISYRIGDYMVLDSPDQCDLNVGLIDMIFLNKSTQDTFFLMSVKPALNTFQGYYKIMMPAISYRFSCLQSLPDYYPLPSYNVGGQQCISLKHTIVQM
ncbi:DNA topoisomerase 3-alpha [Frankliniella fusca]|uniref:DNA topoisomerase 3-alpha n=1 Tax=Frankliniella fusca TaxID=407009 RepID=A0AAE1HG95_9NEOP|nr:DNA topoisomerase 3-alpha [Frankliniella fusca]